MAKNQKNQGFAAIRDVVSSSRFRESRIYGAYESLHNFDYWLKTLKSTHFFQCHRCFLVNMYFISSYDDTSIYLYNNTYTALIARRKKNDFQKAYSMFIENNM